VGSAVFTFPDQRRRAAGGYTPVLVYALVGALVALDWLSTPEGFSLEPPTFEQGETIGIGVEVRGWEAARP
jgi:hypothetical protein